MVRREKSDPLFWSLSIQIKTPKITKVKIGRIKKEIKLNQKLRRLYFLILIFPFNYIKNLTSIISCITIIFTLVKLSINAVQNCFFNSKIKTESRLICSFKMIGISFFICFCVIAFNDKKIIIETFYIIEIALRMRVII